MPMTYRKPGVYLEESLLVNPADVSGAVTVAAFVGAAAQGPINMPVLVESWSQYVTLFGGFNAFAVPDSPPGTPQPHVRSYLPYSIYSFFQSGGRSAYVIRAIPSVSGQGGTVATITVNGLDTTADILRSFAVNARSVGTWGNRIKYNLGRQNPGTDPESVFTLQVLLQNAEGHDEVVETFSSMSMKGTLPGTRRIDSVVNDPFSGSQYISISEVNDTQQPSPTTSAIALAGGIDPAVPDAADLQSAAQLLATVEGPINLNVAGYVTDVGTVDTADWANNYVGTTIPSSFLPDRQDIFIINDNAPPRIPNQSSAAYKSLISNSSALGANTGDSYSASFGPWIIIQDPQRVGATLSIPPGGAVAGVMSRIDATVGVFRAPAGLIGSISNAVGVQTKFSDSDLGDLNSGNINVIRPMVGSGMCIMGARTRKSYGADRYISARRTLIYVKEVMKRSSQFALFENNDQRLWLSLIMAAERVLRPLWEGGGLKGNNAAEAYFIKCDATINNPNVIAAGEVRVEIGLALEYPAEFIIIRVSQFDQSTFTSEVTPTV